jgi:hypothetical protein
MRTAVRVPTSSIRPRRLPAPALPASTAVVMPDPRATVSASTPK